MSYMDEKYNSRLLITVDRDDRAIGPINRGSTSWSSMNSGSREGMTRSSVDRDLMAQVPRDREGMLLGRIDFCQFDRNDLPLGRMGRDSVARDHMEKDSLARLRIDREDLGRGHVGRDDLAMGRMPQSLLDRGDVVRGRLDIGDIPSSHKDMDWRHMDRDWRHLERDDRFQRSIDKEDKLRVRDDLVRAPLDRDDLPRVRQDWDLLSRAIQDRGGVARGPLDRDAVARGPLDRDAVARGPLDRDAVARGPLDRDAVARGPLDRDAVARGPLDRDAVARGLLDRDAVARGPLNRDAVGRGPSDRISVPPGLTDKDLMLTVGKSEDQMGKGDANRATASGSVNKEKAQGIVARDNVPHSDMEVSDMEMSDVENSDMVLSDVDPSEVKQDNVEVNADSTDPKKEETAKDDGSEDDKKKYYCEICRLTCLNSMSYLSHIRGKKHVKATRAAENSGLSVMTTSKKKKKIEKTLKDYMAEPVREPLIGLEHVLEYIPPGKVEPSYHCELCDFKTELAPMIQHLNGFKHRKAFISKEFPFLLKAPPGQKEDKVQFLKRMAADIERDGGLKMYRVDVLSKKKKLKSLLDIKPDEINIKRSRWDNTVPNNDAIKAKALQCLEMYEIDSDNEAVTVMIITQRLTENLKTYCLKVKEETEQAEKVARARSVAEALSQVNRAMQLGEQDTFGEGSFPSGGVNRHLDLIHNNQPIPFPAGGLNQNRDPMQIQPPLGSWPPNEPRGPSGFPSGTRGFGNEFNVPARGPIAGSMFVGPSSILNPPSSLLRNNLVAPGISRLVDVPKGQPVEKFIRSLQSQGAAFQPASQTYFDDGPSMMPGNFSADRFPLGPPEKKMRSPLTTEILDRIRGTDVKNASLILLALADSHPELQKVNISNLLNLLVETGIII